MPELGQTGQSALPGAATEGPIAIRTHGMQGMVTIKADLSTPLTTAALAQAMGTDMPPPRAIVTGTLGKIAWMAPDEILVLCAHDDADAVVAVASNALAGQHHLAVNVSDARAMFELTGPRGAIRDAMAKITPADMSIAGVPIGTLRRTRLAQVPGAFWFEDDETLHLICFRSVAGYVFELLQMSAAPDGAVGYY